MKALTYNQYRITNIFLLTLIFVFIESAVTLGANLWFRELPYVLSLAVSFTALEPMRWNLFGAVAAIASGITFCAASGASGQQYLIYCAGNLLMLLAIVFLKKVGKDKVHSSFLLCVSYAVIVFLLAQLGRTIVAVICGASPIIFIQFVTTDSLSCLFAVILLLIVRKQDGLFEDQKSYLIRLEEERREQEDNNEGTLI